MACTFGDAIAAVRRIIWNNPFLNVPVRPGKHEIPRHLWERVALSPLRRIIL